jgi:hypothetical protein
MYDTKNLMYGTVNFETVQYWHLLTCLCVTQKYNFSDKYQLKN